MKKLLTLVFFSINCILFSQWANIGLVGKNVNSITTNIPQNIIFAVADQKLYSTPDEGANWSLLSVDNGQVNIVKVDETNQKLYVGTTKGLYVSNDNGASFQGINNGLPGSAGNYTGVYKILVTNSELVLATNSGIYKSDKTTIQFSRISGILNFDQINDLDFYNGSYYASLLSGLYKKTGESDWELIFNKKVTGLIAQNNQLFLTADYGCSTSGSTEIVFKSIDSGQNWINITPNLPGYACHTLSIFGVENIIFIGASYGGYQSFNNGQNITGSNITSVLDFYKTTTGILAGKEYFSNSPESGGVYYWNYVLLKSSEINSNKKIIYPVPSKDFIYIENKEKKDQNITIYNTVGQKVFKTNSNSSRISIDIRNLEKGIYYLEMINGTEKSNQKIIKN